MTVKSGDSGSSLPDLEGMHQTKNKFLLVWLGCIASSLVSFSVLYGVFFKYFKARIAAYFIFMVALLVFHLGFIGWIIKSKRLEKLWISLFLNGVLILLMGVFYSFGKEGHYDEGMPDVMLRIFRIFRNAQSPLLIQNSMLLYEIVEGRKLQKVMLFTLMTAAFVCEVLPFIDAAHIMVDLQWAWSILGAGIAGCFFL